MILKPRQFRKPNLGHRLSRNLVGFWLGNGGKGDTKVYDLSGYNNTGTLQGTAPSWTSGKFGSAILLPGTDEYIDCGNKTSLNVVSSFTIIISITLNQFTTEAGWDSRIVWFYPIGNNSIQLCSADAGADLEADGFLIKVIHDTNIKQVASIGQVTGKRYLVVATYDGTTPHLYIDGILSEGGTLDGVPGVGNMGNLRIGSRDDDKAATDCLLDYVMIYNRALSKEEITYLYQKPFCMFGYDPIELWSAATLGAAPPVGMAGAMTTNTGYWGW